MRLCALILAILLSATHLAGQENPDSVRHRKECRFARQVVLAAGPSSYLRWSLGYLAACGAGEQGTVVARAVRALRTETDTAVLRPYWRVSTYVRDRRLFEAAEEIALDRAASTQARVFAISALFTATSPYSYADYEDLVGGFTPDGLVAGGCETFVAGEFRRTDTPLPTDAVRRVASVRQRLLADGSEPLDVRTAATCLPSR